MTINWPNSIHTDGSINYVSNPNPELSFESYRGAAIILFTYPGTPSIYYGNEIGLTGH
jgi:glycosidase